jgi:hypothetical protein
MHITTILKVYFFWQKGLEPYSTIFVSRPTFNYCLTAIEALTIIGSEFGASFFTSPGRPDIFGTHSSSYPKDTWGFIPGDKASWAWSWRLTSSKCRGQQHEDLYIRSSDHSGRPRSLRHELSSLARTLGSWIRIPLKAWMSIFCAFIPCFCCSVYR